MPLSSLVDAKVMTGIRNKIALLDITTIGDFIRRGEDLNPRAKRQILRIIGQSLPGYTNPDR